MEFCPNTSKLYYESWCVTYFSKIFSCLQVLQNISRLHYDIVAVVQTQKLLTVIFRKFSLNTGKQDFLTQHHWSYGQTSLLVPTISTTALIKTLILMPARFRAYVDKLKSKYQIPTHWKYRGYDFHYTSTVTDTNQSTHAFLRDLF